jgi:hypothetical protein
MVQTWFPWRARSCRSDKRRGWRALVVERLEDRTLLSGVAWNTFGKNAQHTALSDVPSQALGTIGWQTPVDLYPQYNGGGSLLIHYGSPLVTDANTVVVPVKIGQKDGFQVEGHSGTDGSLLWTAGTDYTLPPSLGWTPSYSPVLTPTNRLYFPGAGGTLYYMDHPDDPGAPVDGQVAFYGIDNYDHSLDSKVFINTPLTSDSAGDIFFGFRVTGSNMLNLKSGIARIGPDGAGTWVAASTAAGDNNVDEAATGSTPAVSSDGTQLYVAVSRSSNEQGYLLALDSTSLETVAKVALKDPKSGGNARVSDSSTASPTVGPDGRVYFGVLAGNGVVTHGRGWMLQFTSDLVELQPPGAFGWDDTVSIVPRDMVPSYQGQSDYLLMTKYNNYAGNGGDGINKIAILDPNDVMFDPIDNWNVMNEVLTIAGVTPDPDFPDHPGAVREWCIDNAAVDRFTGSILANSEDGSLYRWDLATNTFTESISLTKATGEAYTPTVIGVDGTVYAINNANLFGVQAGVNVAHGHVSLRVTAFSLLVPDNADFANASTKGSSDLNDRGAPAVTADVPPAKSTAIPPSPLPHQRTSFGIAAASDSFVDEVFGTPEFL